MLTQEQKELDTVGVSLMTGEGGDIHDQATFESLVAYQWQLDILRLMQETGCSWGAAENACR